MDKYFKVKNFYNSNVQDYAKKSAILLHEQLNYFLRNMPPKGRILDVGCGPGHDTEFFSKKGFDAIGIDFSYGFIKYSQKNRRCGKFKGANMLDIGKIFPKNYFDGIWMSSSLTHLENKDIVKVLKQIKNILTSKGSIAIIVKKRTKRKLKNKDIINKYFYKKEIINFLEASKLSLVSMSSFNALNKEWFFVVAKK